MKIGPGLTIGPRTWWIIVVVSLLSAGALVEIIRGSWQTAGVFGVALQVVTIAIVVLAAKRPSPYAKNAKALTRIERAIDNVSLRVINESTAIQRELKGRSDGPDRSPSAD